MSNSVSNLVSATLLLLAGYKVWTYLTNSKNTDWYAAPRLPFLGSIPFILKHKGIFNTSMRDELGSGTYLVKLGVGPELLLVTSVKDAKKFEACEEHLKDRTRPYFYAHELHLHDDFMPSEDTSPELLAKRKAVLFGAQQMLQTNGLYKDSGLERACQQLIKDIDEKLNQPLEHRQLVDLFVPCIGVMGMSLSYGLRWTEEIAGPAITLVHALTDTLGLIGGGSLHVPFPFLRFIFFRQASKVRKQASTAYNTLATAREQLYQHAVSSAEANGVESLEPSTLKWILSDPNKHGMSKPDIVAAVAAALGGSTDTSSHALAALSACLAAWPEWQTKIRDELRQNNVLDDISAESLRTQAPLLTAFLREAFRVYGIIRGTSRKASADFQVDGKVVYKGTGIIFNRFAINRDPDFYGEDASEFKPDRFLRNPPNLSKYGHTTFGAGRRRCPGADLAETFLLAAVANILGSFEIGFVEKGPMGADALSTVQAGALWAQTHRPVAFKRL